MGRSRSRRHEEAYRWTEHLVNGSRVQLRLMASDAELVRPSDEICRRTSSNMPPITRAVGSMTGRPRYGNWIKLTRPIVPR